MRFWWVNQNQTFRHEIAGGYLWAPKRKSNSARNYFYETMREVAPGDLVFSFANTLIPAIGVAKSYGYASPKPAEFGSAGINWSTWGWRVDVDFQPLINKIRPKDHMERIAPAMPPKYSPLQLSGAGNQGVYLTEIPTDMAYVLVDLIGAEAKYLLQINTQQVAEATGASATGTAAEADVAETYEEIQEQEIVQDHSIIESERLALVRARRGQGKFRQQVSELESECRITHVNNPIHLIARHIKPWRNSTNQERIDGENGLLLTPSIDHLFGRGFISFSDNGKLICSPVADKVSLTQMGVPVEKEVLTGAFTRKQQQYLEYHRDEILKQKAVG